MSKVINRQIDDILSQHISDCAVYNEPAYSKERCSCRKDGLLNRSDMRMLAKLTWQTPIKYTYALLCVMAQHRLDLTREQTVDSAQEADIQNLKYL